MPRLRGPFVIGGTRLDSGDALADGAVRSGNEDPANREADARTRTGDPFITSEVLYQLSYVGSAPTVAASVRR
jgi:hypothetical protein